MYGYLNTYDHYDDWCYEEPPNPKADELEERIAYAADFMKKIIDAAYGMGDFDPEEFHNDLEECAAFLDLNVPSTQIHLGRVI